MGKRRNLVMQATTLDGTTFRGDHPRYRFLVDFGDSELGTA